MMGFAAVPWMLFALSLLMALLGGWILLRQRWLSGWLLGNGGLALVLGALALGLHALGLQALPLWEPERPLATVSFRQVAPQQFVATVALADGASHDYALQGDLWRLDARVLGWRPPLSRLNRHRAVVVESLQGRYLSLAAERSRPAAAAVPTSTPVLSRQVLTQSPLLQAVTARVEFLPMVDGAIFQVVPAGPAGSVQLDARPLNGIAEAAMLE